MTSRTIYGAKRFALWGSRYQLLNSIGNRLLMFKWSPTAPPLDGLDGVCLDLDGGHLDGGRT